MASEVRLRDAEQKILLGFRREEMERIEQLHSGHRQRAMLIVREQ